MTTPAYIPQIRLYQDWLSQHKGLRFDSYDDLWRWSTTDLDAFWQSIWDYFDLRSPTPHQAALVKNAMPGAQWFTGARLNYAQQVFRHVEAAHAAGLMALVSRNEKGLHQELSWPELKRQAASLALHLKAQGLQPGDRVAAYLPNIPQAMVAFLATVSLGGVWSICAPDMGTHAVLDRFAQIEPKILIACDGVRYGGREHDRMQVVSDMRAQLPSVQHLILLRNLNADARLPDSTDYDSTITRDDAATAQFQPLSLPFDHPLWIVYSSGTTGLPKPIVHGHGGSTIVALALKVLHNDVGCSYHPNSWGERYHWYSSTGWVMWNAQMSGLLNGTTCVIYDGNPGGTDKDQPDWGTLWRFAADTGATFFGAGAAFFANCLKSGLDLSQWPALARVRALGTTGSPLSEDAQRWGTEQFRTLRAMAARSGMAGAQAADQDIWWCNISGGTDFAGAFIGGNRELPLIPGQMQCRLLGCAVESWNEQGQPVVDAVGELVCTQPMPSMPLYFWNDAGNARYLASYFDMYPAGHGRQPGGGDASPEMGAVWRHGDWLKVTPSGACVIYGRSDATINRHGLRMGTSELYSAVEALPEVMDSMVVDLEYLGRESYMPLFVVLRDGLVLDEAMKSKLNEAIRTALSPRFVPNDIFQVVQIPRTLTGKKQELPIKKLMLGQPLEKVVNQDAMANPGCLPWYVSLAKRHLESA
ncbi:acetoacetate--CoA ligase [Limnohabitans sp. JirII-31]|uniref:acetoacetate--CoA ligase n=1 Tax=Limnohabitans sp. JirII-31 TaxID=1977908 RepID=UPI000C1E107E|nr:acetoacetate--CoA ligase [Limnohabitans sp. JirII-31]PIT78397.1 acetoacetate--CoA ligase [Limnohabitans sp. JirII-31]